MPYTYEYERGALTVDAVVFGLDDDLKVLLIQRDIEPFEGSWALPGGFVRVNEKLEDAVMRELQEETGMTEVYLEQLYTFGAVNRDPRERVVSVAYYALVKLEGHKLQASTDARNTAWFSLDDLPELAFDHSEVLKAGLERIKGKVRYQPIGFELLHECFSLTQLQKMYEIILDRELDKRNFRKKILKMDLLIDTGEIEKDVSHRAAKLYRFDKEKYDQLIKTGFNFEV